MVDEFLSVVKKVLDVDDSPYRGSSDFLKLTSKELEILIETRISEDELIEKDKLRKYFKPSDDATRFEVRLDSKELFLANEALEIILGLIFEKIFFNLCPYYKWAHVLDRWKYLFELVNLLLNSKWSVSFSKLFYLEPEYFCGLFDKFDNNEMTRFFRNQTIPIDQKYCPVDIIDNSRFVNVSFPRNFGESSIMMNYLYLLGRHTDPSTCQLAFNNSALDSKINREETNFNERMDKEFSRGRAEYLEEKGEYLSSCLVCLKQLLILPPPGIAKIVAEYSF
jgi:hypothetical protein